MKDDSIGVRTAEAIKEKLNKRNIGVVIAETDFDFGLEAVKAYNYVIVLDAMVSGGKPGQVTVFSLFNAEVQKRYASQHDMSLIDMIAKEGNVLGSLIGIEAEDVGFGFELSKTLQNNFNVICNNVQKEILRIKEGLTVHDSLLFEKTYQTVRELCKNNSIKKVNEIKLIVSMDSHVDGPHMLSHFIERDNTLFGDWANVIVEKRDIEKLTAVIESIDGEKDD